MRTMRYLAATALVAVSLQSGLTAQPTDTFYNTAGKLGITAGYPYLGLRYDFTDLMAGELRGAFDGGVAAIGYRQYFNILQFFQLRVFAGGEASYVMFNNVDELTGSGFLVGLFGGGEFFVTDWFGLAMDFGPAYVALGTDQAGTSYTAGGVELILNLGVNFYF